jgi:hypothetical protein
MMVMDADRAMVIVSARPWSQRDVHRPERGSHTKVMVLETARPARRAA